MSEKATTISRGCADHVSDAEARDYLMSAAGHRSQDGGGRAQLRTRSRRDAGRHPRAPGHEAPRARSPPRPAPSGPTASCTSLIPDGLRTPLHVGLIRLGREICKAPTPRCADLSDEGSLPDGSPVPGPGGDRHDGARRVRSSERVRGIEPPFQAWEAYVLPLNHTRRARTAGAAASCQRSDLLGRFGTAGRRLLASGAMTQQARDLDRSFWPHDALPTRAHEDLNADEAAEAMRAIMAGEATPRADRRVPHGACGRRVRRPTRSRVSPHDAGVRDTRSAPWRLRSTSWVRVATAAARSTSRP